MRLGDDPNPLAIFGIRRTKSCLPHFATVPLPKNMYDFTEILNWITVCTEGRFFFGKFPVMIDGVLEDRTCVAFEDHGEASVFALILPQINNNMDGLL